MKLKWIKEPWIIGCITVMAALFLFFNARKDRQFTWSDAEGYYMYLPAITKYGFADIPLRTPGQFVKVEATGNYYDKYTAGVSIMQAPFYLLAYLYAAIDPSTEPDGYSMPFQQSIFIAALFYCFGGLYILYLLLRKRYSLVVSLITLLCIFLGTNLFYYTYREPGMAHVYSFFLWCALIPLTANIYDRPSWRSFFHLSLIIGLLVFIRPTNALGAIFILFYDFPGFRERLHFIRTHFTKFLVLLLPFLVLTCIQLYLWYLMSGKFIAFSYNEEPGFIFLKDPKMLNVLFHVHNGLFIYAPILLLGVIGLLIGIESKQKNFILFGTLLLVATYFFGSWWAWWFGGAYGHRSYVDLLPIFTFPLALFIDYLWRARFYTIRVLGTLICFFLIYYSMYMSYVYRSPWDGPGFGWPQYWDIVKKMI